MELYLDNDHLVRLSGLSNGLTGASISDADVAVTILDETAGTEVAGIAWPLTLDPVAGEPGAYHAVIDQSAELVLGSYYIITVTASDVGSGLDATWQDRKRCQRRPFG